MTIDKLLIATDFSPDAAAAAELGVAIAEAHGAKVTILHAVDRLVHASIPPYVAAEQIKDQQAAATRQLGELRTSLADSAVGEIEINTVSVNADPVSGVLRLAAELQPTMIVLGSRGDHNDGRFLIGSVALSVSRDARCPVLVARAAQRDRFSRTGRFHNPLVAIDYSKFSQPAMQLAATLATHDATIELIHVVHAPEAVDDRSLRNAITEVRAQELQRLERFSASIDIAPVAIKLRSEAGRVAGSVLDYVESSHTDLVVIGAHGRDTPVALIGSVADRILRHSAAPVAFLPEAAVAPLG